MLSLCGCVLCFLLTAATGAAAQEAITASDAILLHVLGAPASPHSIWCVLRHVQHVSHV